MQIAISLSENNGLNSNISQVFGRCEFFMIIDPETRVFTIEENPAKKASGGAGVRASQYLIEKEIHAVISGNLGPKAHEVLSSADIQVFKYQTGSIEETLKAYSSKKLESLIEPNVNAHSGIN